MPLRSRVSPYSSRADACPSRNPRGFRGAFSAGESARGRLRPPFLQHSERCQSPVWGLGMSWGPRCPSLLGLPEDPGRASEARARSGGHLRRVRIACFGVGRRRGSRARLPPPAHVAARPPRPGSRPRSRPAVVPAVSSSRPRRASEVSEGGSLGTPPDETLPGSVCPGVTRRAPEPDPSCTHGGARPGSRGARGGTGRSAGGRCHRRPGPAAASAGDADFGLLVALRESSRSYFRGGRRHLSGLQPLSLDFLLQVGVAGALLAAAVGAAGHFAAGEPRAERSRAARSFAGRCIFHTARQDAAEMVGEGGGR